MDKNAWIKWTLLLLFILFSITLVTPTHKRVKRGLDIQGGSSFTVEVDEGELRNQMRQRDMDEIEVNRQIGREIVQARDVALEAIRNRVDGMGITEPQIFPTGENRLIVQMPGIDAQKREDARRSIESVAFLEFRLVHRQSGRWVRRLLEENRAPRGFRFLSTTHPTLARDSAAVPDKEMDRAFWAEVRAFMPREGAEFFLERATDEAGVTIFRPHYLETTVLLTGDAIKDAKMDYDEMQRPKILLEFTSQGGNQFAQITRDYAPGGDKNPRGVRGRQLAILLDGTLYSAPEIRSEILGGRGEITGQFSATEATRIVNALRSGSLLAPMRIIEERSVAASLGRKSVRAGVRAAWVAAGLVCVFMIAYYKVAGVIANLALALTLLLLPFAAWLVSGLLGVLTGATGGGGIGLPTLTLPGIAGIVLTLGMAVDANVLIYERIREEQKTGKGLLPAIDAGYDKAFSTILDANITTLLAAVIMFWLGAGPVRGFAVMLSAGILASMFTAIVVTRLFFHVLVKHGKLTLLRMVQWIRDTRIDFLGASRVGIAVSVLLLIVSVATFGLKGNGILGIDFVGGAALTVGFDEPVPDDQVRNVLTRAGIGGATVQYQDVTAGSEEGSMKNMLIVRVPFDADKPAAEALTAAFSEQGFEILQKESVGPQIGRELKRKGTLALLWAMIGMVIYISWRFEFSYAVAAIAALIHDAVVSIGIFALLGRQINMPMIAVVLTIVGYSVNDTIVIFDRIRELRRLHRERSYREIANESINQTLSRTLLTSVTTLLSVVALLVLGGGAIRDFALLLFIGIIVGTYSTIFVATPITLLWHRRPSAGKTA